MSETTKDTKQKAIVTAWKVEGDIDYEALVKEFGTELIDVSLMEKFKRITGKELHPWITRGIFFSHRSLNQFLDAYEAGEPVFLYTGRGPTSESMHVGHLIPFMFTLWLQQTFDCPLVIQMADDEKFYFRKMKFEDVYRLGFENAKDIIACGFDPKKTFIFSNRDYRLGVKEYEVFVTNMKAFISAKTVRKIFGFDNDAVVSSSDVLSAFGLDKPDTQFVSKDQLLKVLGFESGTSAAAPSTISTAALLKNLGSVDLSTANVGMYDWPFYQSAAAFSSAFPHLFGTRPAHCLVAYAIDQDPYFRMARDLADDMSLIKPYSIMCSFIPPLTGKSGKMSSSSNTDSTIFLTDSPEVVRDKIMKHAFSAGGVTLEEHRKFGGRPAEDISYQYLRYYEFDDAKLEEIRTKFVSGELLCSDLKKLLSDRLCAIIAVHQEKRKLVTNEVLQDFYSFKKMELPVPKKQEQTNSEKELEKLFATCGVPYNFLCHPPTTSAKENDDLGKKIGGLMCKSLLFRGAGDVFYMYVTDNHSVVDTKTLAKKLGTSKLRFAERDFLQSLLGLSKNCCTVFGVMNDKANKVKVVFDDKLQGSTLPLSFPAMENNVHVTLKYTDLVKIMNLVKHEPSLLNSKG